MWLLAPGLPARLERLFPWWPLRRKHNRIYLLTRSATVNQRMIFVSSFVGFCCRGLSDRAQLRDQAASHSVWS